MDGYISWLLDKVEFKHKNFSKLITALDETEYISYGDISRLKDGIYQRDYYEEGYRDGMPCSVLEMLVAFTVRMGDYIGYASDGESHLDWIFKAFLMNLGFKKMNNSSFDRKKFDENIQKWMSGDYDDYGKGSLFPLKKPEKRYYNMDLWKQMNIFLTQYNIENLDFFKNYDPKL